jgi:hypothetical protein
MMEYQSNRDYRSRFDDENKSTKFVAVAPVNRQRKNGNQKEP